MLIPKNLILFIKYFIIYNIVYKILKVYKNLILWGKTNKKQPNKSKKKKQQNTFSSLFYLRELFNVIKFNYFNTLLNVL